jgi:hypothetical protein
MSLCAKCYEKWKEAADQMEVKDDLNNFPWTHCHHEEDCKWCRPGGVIPFNAASIKDMEWNYCPFCGRKL